MADADRDRRGPLPIVAVRHAILTRCGDRDGAASCWSRSVLARGGQPQHDAWYAMVRLATMGRCDSHALAQGEELQRVEGAALSRGNKDPVALAMFRNGRLEQAVALQAEAAAAAGGAERYEARLRRYRDALARSAAGGPPKVR